MTDKFILEFNNRKKTLHVSIFNLIGNKDYLSD